MGKLNKLGVKNSLWNNIRAKAGSGKEPTKEMLEQEAKIKAMGGRMNQAQILNQAKMRVGSDEKPSVGDSFADIGKIMLNNVVSPIEGLTGAEIYNPKYSNENLEKVGNFYGKMQTQAGKMLPQALNMIAPGVGTAVGGAGKAVGSAINGQQEMEQMGAKMSYKQGGLMHINTGGTHEQNALGGVPIGPNALVEQGETINNDFVFSDRLKPKGSKRTYAQLSKSIDTKYKLRPDDKLSKEAKQMDLDNLAMQQEAQKSEMATKYMNKAMAMGGTIMGPISQSQRVTNGQNTLLANGGLISNFMEPETQYVNPANLSNQFKYGGNMYPFGGPTTPYFTGPDDDATYIDQDTLSPYVEQPLDYSSINKSGLNPNYLDATRIGIGFPTKRKKLQRAEMNSIELSPNSTTQVNRMLNPELPININSVPYNTSNLQIQGVEAQPYNFAEQDLANYNIGSQNTNAPVTQNPQGKVGNVGYLSNLAGNLAKTAMVATSKDPIYNPSLKFNRLNSTAAERLAMQEGLREIQGTKDIIRNNATSSGQYLTNASLMGSSTANKLAGTIAGVRQEYDNQNVGIGNQEAQLNQQITAGNNLAKEQFRDNRLNQYNKILDSVIGANQQRFAKDEQANNYQNQVISMLKTKDFRIGKKDNKGMYEILDINGNIVGTLGVDGTAKDLLGNPIN